MTSNHNRLSEPAIRGALVATAGNVTLAAERLAVHRNVLYRRLELLGIEPKAFRPRRRHERTEPPGAPVPGGAGAPDLRGGGAEALAGATEVLVGRAELFAGGEVFARSAEVHRVHRFSRREVHAPLSGGSSGSQCGNSSSVGAVSSVVAEDDQQNGRLSRKVLSLSGPLMDLVACQRRLLSAALNRDFTDGAMFELFIREDLVGWVSQKVRAAARTRATHNNGSNGRNGRK
jgi:hypothetical protein